MTVTSVKKLTTQRKRDAMKAARILLGTSHAYTLSDAAQIVALVYSAMGFNHAEVRSSILGHVFDWRAAEDAEEAQRAGSAP
jgi:hypothetical protein